MKENKQYNGWANYETWNVALWFGNDEGLYNLARDYRENNGRFKARSVRDFVEDILPNGTPDFQDMGKANCYKKVKWSEIADAFNEL